MAQKKITDLQLIDEVTGTLNFPSDDTLQSYRATASQIKDYVLGAGNVPRTALAVGAVARKTVLSKTATDSVSLNDDLTIADATSGAIVFSLPTAVGASGRVLSFYRLDKTLNTVTINPDGSETIDGKSSILLYSTLNLVSDGAVWKVLGAQRAYQQIKYDTRAGFGSTNTQIPYFTNTIESKSNGSDLFTASNSSTLGNSFTILKRCKISISFTAEHTSTGEEFGISKNATAMTTPGQFVSASNSIRLAQGSSSGSIPQTKSITIIGEPGDVFRAHSNNPGNLGTASDWYVTVFAEEI